MSDPQPPSSSAPDDSDPTVKVPAPSDLIRANAGRILGEMLDEGLSGMECEGDSIGSREEQTQVDVRGLKQRVFPGVTAALRHLRRIGMPALESDTE